MKRIILHWTAGAYQPNDTDYEHYHKLVNGQGLVINGKYTPEDNENCNDGKYAAHTGGGNTGSIGVAMCCMFGYTSRANVGKYPMTKAQFERCCKVIAELSKEYNIPITPQTVMTHYEFGCRNPKTSSAGKIDITYLPPYPAVPQNDIGNFIRSKARWYLQQPC